MSLSRFIHQGPFGPFFNPATTAPWATFDPFQQPGTMFDHDIIRDMFSMPTPPQLTASEEQQKSGALAAPSSAEYAKLWQPQWPALHFENTDDHHIITAHVPGFTSKGDESKKGAVQAPGQGNAPYGTVSIDVDNGVLTITADHKNEEKKKDEKGECSASTSSYYRRSVKLPEGVRSDDVKANLSHGVLKATMPRAKAPASEKSKSVTILTS